MKIEINSLTEMYVIDIAISNTNVIIFKKTLAVYTFCYQTY